MKFLLLLFLFPFLLLSCGPTADEMHKADSLRKDSIRKDSLAKNFVEVCSEGICITLPRHFIPVTGLNDEAMMQFSDSDKEEYLIIMSEDKKTFLDSVPMMDYYDGKLGAVENYRTYWKTNMHDGLDSMYNVDLSEFSSKFSQIKKLNFIGVIPDVPEPVAYSMAFIEGKTKMYVVTAWTLESLRNVHDAELNYCLESFREQQ